MREDFRRFCSPGELQRSTLCYSDGMGFESNPSFLIDRRSFHNYLIMYTVKGRLWCCQYGQEIAVEEGEYILLDLHAPHKYFFDAAAPSKIAWAHLNGQPVRQLICQIGCLSPLPLKRADSWMLSCLMELFRLADQPEPDDFSLSCQLYAILTGILGALYSIREESPGDPRQEEFKKTVWHIIMHNLHRKLTVGELAQYMCLSKYHFIRRFHASFGLPPMQFVLEEKIRVAKYMLAYTADSVCDIAEHLGFSTSSYFDKTFRKLTGFSPSGYRKYGYLSEPSAETEVGAGSPLISRTEA